MTFEMALACMKAGMRVRQKSCPTLTFSVECDVIVVHFKEGMRTCRCRHMRMQQIMAKDWEVCE